MWKWDVMRKILYCVSDSFFVSCWNVGFDAPVVFKGRCNVPSIDTMWCPCASFSRVFPVLGHEFQVEQVECC